MGLAAGRLAAGVRRVAGGLAGADGRRAALGACLAAMALPAAAAIEIDRFTTRGAGAANTYLVQTSAGTVIVDTQRQAALGSRLVVTVEPPVAGILLTHPHPDHVGGLERLMAAFDTRLFASRATADEMLDDTRGLLAFSREQLGPDFPERLPRPDDLVGTGDRLSFGDTTFEVFEYSASEAVTMTLYYIRDEDILFSGDLLTPGMTPFLLEKRTLEWIAQLQDLAARFPDDTLVYPGHGATGELGPMVAAQIEYLQTFRNYVKSALADGALSAAETEQVAVLMRSAYPGYEPASTIPNLLERNIVAVALELTGDPGAPPVATLEE